MIRGLPDGAGKDMELNKTGQSLLLNCLMEMGDLMLDAGAEINREIGSTRLNSSHRLTSRMPSSA